MLLVEKLEKLKEGAKLVGDWKPPAKCASHCHGSFKDQDWI